MEEFEEGPRQKRKVKKPWQVDYTIGKLTLSIEEEPLLQLFTNKDEVVDLLAQRQIFLCSASKKYSMLKQLKEEEVYRNFCHLRGTNLSGRVEMPKRF